MKKQVQSCKFTLAITLTISRTFSISTRKSINFSSTKGFRTPKACKATEKSLAIKTLEKKNPDVTFIMLYIISHGPQLEKIPEFGT